MVQITSVGHAGTVNDLMANSGALEVVMAYDGEPGQFCYLYSSEVGCQPVPFRGRLEISWVD